MSLYKVLKQAIAYEGAIYHPERNAGSKVIPADEVEMDDDTAKAFGKEYLQKIGKGKEKDEDADKNTK